MGFAKGAFQLMLQEACRRPFCREVLTLGKQQTFLTPKIFQCLRKKISGISLPPTASQINSRGFLTDDYVFRSLGFSQVRALDCSDYEGADIIFDLNRTDLPADLENRFDVIYDGGTVEHVFNTANALFNIFKMLKIGGRIIHASPSSNHMDHGYYMFSPRLFFEFYYVNGFEINSFQICRYTPDHDTAPWKISDYPGPGCLEGRVTFGGLDDGMYLISCIASKTPQSTGNIAPQQKDYLEFWERSKKNKDTDRTCQEWSKFPVSGGWGARANPPWTAGVKKALQKLPALYYVLRPAYRSFRYVYRRLRPAPKGLGLQVIARY